MSADPKYVCQNILPRTPRVFSLFCTLDGRELILRNDGGTYRNGQLAGPNSGAAQAYSAISKRDKDGMPVFVAREPIEPSYPGDLLCTPTADRRGAITLLSPDTAKKAEAKIAKHKERLEDFKSDAKAKIKSEVKK